jgi:hypothetical protein
MFVHRAVLVARWPAFSKILADSYKEGDTFGVNNFRLEHPEVVRAVVEWIYKGTYSDIKPLGTFLKYYHRPELLSYFRRGAHAMVSMKT